MRRRSAVALLALLSATCGGGAKTYELKLPELHADLKNGIRVIVLPDPTTDLVEVDVRYEVGSNEDPPGKEGLAHLVEHLMFQHRTAGEDKPPIWAAIRQLTVFSNAYTNNDTTHYEMLAKKDNFEQLVAIEAARLYAGCQTIPESSFEREREVVRNEMRTRIGTPEGEMGTILLTDIYPQGHPYARETGGDDASISSLTLQDACKFMQDYYVPERATMIIAGNVTEQEAGQVTGRWLSDIPARKGAPRRTVPPLDLHYKKIEHELDVEEPTIVVAWKLPPRFTEEFSEASFMMGAMLGGTGFFGEEYEFATSVDGGVIGGALAPVFVLQVSLRDPSKVDEALEFIWKAARSAHRGMEEGNEGTEDGGFEGLRRRLQGRLAMQMESLGDRTDRFGDYAQFDKEQKFFAGELARIRNMDGDRVRSRVKASLKKDDAVVVVIKSKHNGKGKYRRAPVSFNGGGEQEKFEVDPAEAMESVAVPAQTTSLTKAKDFKLGNGMRVILMPTQSSLPIVTVNLVFAAGSAIEPPEDAGLADLAAQGLYVEGANPIGYVGASQGARAGQDSTTFQARGLNIYLDVLIHGLERLIKAGDYDQEGIERDQKFFKFGMARKSASSRTVFRQKLVEAIYGKDHPYAKTGIPTVQTYSRIGRDMAFDFKTKHFSARNATIIVTGSFEEKEAERWIREYFGDWSSGHMDDPVLTEAAARDHALHIGVDGEESATVTAVIAYPGPVGIDKQQAARLILAEILDERVSTLREKLGSSYGVSAGYQTHRGPGMYVVSGPIDAERAGESVAALRQGIDDLRKGGGDYASEFVRARRKVLEDLLTTASDSQTLAFQLDQIATYGLPLDHYDKLIRQVANMTPEEVMMLIRSDLSPEREVVGLLGPRASLEKAFRDAGINDAQIVE